MLDTLALSPGVTLHCIQSHRFKQGVLSVQFVRPMDAAEASTNALIPEILLRGCRQAPDLRQITLRLDDLYGAAVGTQVRRVGDYQTLGLSCSFLDDRFALPGDRVLGPMAEFLCQLLTQPVLENGAFCREYVRGEKRNLISTLEAQRNDKQAYATARLLKNMCRGDSFGLPRLGTVSQVRRITPEGAYDHYKTVLRESPVQIMYVGSAPTDVVAELMTQGLSGLERAPRCLPAREEFHPAKPSRRSQRQAVTQGKLAMGFVTPITYDDPRFAAMQLCNNIFGAGMTSKLFLNVREAKSLCYAIGSGYYGSKGILTVHAGIDTCRYEETVAAITEQLAACQAGQITEQELHAAREAVLSGLRAIYDSPGAMEAYFSTAAIGDLGRAPEEYARQIRDVRVEDVVQAARTVGFHSSFFLKGTDHE